MLKVIAPVVYTLITASRAALSWIDFTVAGLSIVGEVLGMQTTEVKPPIAAAADPEAISSFAV